MVPAPPDAGAPPRAPGRFCGTGSPCTHRCGRSAPHPGLLSRVEKVGKDTPRAAPFGIPGTWLPHFPRSLRFAPARAVLLPAFLPAALQARQHGGHIPPRLSPPPFGTLIACGFPFPYSGKKLLRARWGAQAVHNRRGPIRVRKRTPETKGKTLFYILYSINLFLIEIVVFRFQEADKWRS